MNRVVLCEGYDDVVFLGYYLYKITGGKCEFSSNIKEVSDNLHLPKSIAKNERREIYKFGNDYVLIWAVGGKNNFEKAIKYISRIGKSFPDERFTEIFIVTDRDHSCTETVSQEISTLFQKYDWNVDLKNNRVNTYKYYAEDSNIYNVDIIPIVVPFEEDGAIETVLLNSLAENDEEEIIVNEAKKYVSIIEHDSGVNTYLQHDRDKVKARFSAAMSVINPDHSTDKMNKVLVSHAWEKAEEVNKHFALIKDSFCKIH